MEELQACAEVLWLGDFRVSLLRQRRLQRHFRRSALVALIFKATLPATPCVCTKRLSQQGLHLHKRQLANMQRFHP